jgi:hypothetical protein
VTTAEFRHELGNWVMNNKPGWYYTADGRLRYRDEDGWTEYYVDFDEIRGEVGSPPPPMTMLEQVRAREAQLRASKPRRRRRLGWRR